MNQDVQEYLENENFKCVILNFNKEDLYPAFFTNIVMPENIPA